MTEEQRKINNERAKRINLFYKALDELFNDIDKEESDPSYT